MRPDQSAVEVDLKDKRAESRISDQAKTHGISEDEVIEQIMLTEPTIKRLIASAEVAGFAAFLCSPESSFINGVPLTMHGGWTAR